MRLEPGEPVTVRADESDPYILSVAVRCSGAVVMPHSLMAYRHIVKHLGMV